MRIKLWTVTGSALLLAFFAHANRATTSPRQLLFPIDAEAYLLGRFDPGATEDFIRLPEEQAGDKTIYLRTQVAEALGRMVMAAREDGVILWVVSGTRSFLAQKTIWEGTFEGRRILNGRNLAEAYPDTLERIKAILNYSSAPGTSRHHWGTDVDLNSVRLAYWETGEGARTLDWLNVNAANFGFHMAYIPGRRHGYKYEAWHWSYEPMSRPMLHYYRKLITQEDLAGFVGAEWFKTLPWKAWYVEGINPKLK